MAGLVAIVWPGEETARLTEYWAYLMTWSWSDQAREWAFFQRFTSGLFDSAWLMAGRLRYPAPPAWLTAVRLLTVVAAAGCVIGARRSGLAPWRPGIVLAGALVAIQIAGVYVGVYMNGFGPQGRYLLPVVGPFMALFWIGLHSWWPRRSWPLVSAVVVTLMFVLDAIGWAEVLIARVSWLVRWVRDDR